jgi:hypothetical protein
MLDGRWIEACLLAWLALVVVGLVWSVVGPPLALPTLSFFFSLPLFYSHCLVSAGTIMSCNALMYVCSPGHGMIDVYVSVAWDIGR